MKYSFHITSKSWQTAKASLKFSPFWLLFSFACLSKHKMLSTCTWKCSAFCRFYSFISTAASKVIEIAIFYPHLPLIPKWVCVWFYWEINKYITEPERSRHHHPRHFLDCNINLCNQSYGVCTAYFMMPSWLLPRTRCLHESPFLGYRDKVWIGLGFIVSSFGMRSVNNFENSSRLLLERKC